MATNPSLPAFQHANTSNDFNNRASIFDSLGSIEKKYDQHLEDNKTELFVETKDPTSKCPPETLSKKRTHSKIMAGSRAFSTSLESIHEMIQDEKIDKMSSSSLSTSSTTPSFKTPPPFASRNDLRVKLRKKGLTNKKVPDHVASTGNWQKYSLDQDGTESAGIVGNKLNTAIALDLMQSLKASTENRSGHQDDNDVDMTDSTADRTKVQFKKPGQPSEMSSLSALSPSSVLAAGTNAHAFVTTAFEFGQKKKPALSLSSSRHQVSKTSEQLRSEEGEDANAVKELSLGHLEKAKDDDDYIKVGETEEDFSIKGEEDLAAVVAFSKRKHNKRKVIRKKVEENDEDE